MARRSGPRPGRVSIADVRSRIAGQAIAYMAGGPGEHRDGIRYTRGFVDGVRFALDELDDASRQNGGTP